MDRRHGKELLEMERLYKEEMDAALRQLTVEFIAIDLRRAAKSTEIARQFPGERFETKRQERNVPYYIRAPFRSKINIYKQYLDQYDETLPRYRDMNRWIDELRTILDGPWNHHREGSRAEIHERLEHSIPIDPKKRR